MYTPEYQIWGFAFMAFILLGTLVHDWIKAGGLRRIGAMKDRFLLWLNDHIL